MSKTYNAAVGREYAEGKMSWTNIGKGFESQSGNITLLLNALPISTGDGQAKVVLFLDKDNSKNANTSSYSGSQQSDYQDDDIPF